MMIRKIAYKIPVLLLLFISCESESHKLELFNPEAFAYYLEDGWELVGTVRVKGFSQTGADDEVGINLEYYVHIVTPLSDTLAAIDHDYIEEKLKEEVTDKEIEVQIYFDGNFSHGNYILIFDVKDLNTGQSAKISKDFILSAE